MSRTLRRLLLVSWLLSAPGAGAMDLLKTYEMALERDPEFHAAEANRNAILQTKPIAIAQLLPNLSFRGRMNRNHVLVKSTPIVAQRGQDVFFWDNTMDVNLNQPIYRHELWVQLSQADNQIAAAEAQYAAAEQDVTFRASRAYFDVLLAEANLSFAQAENVATERQYEQAKARFEVGLIAITDVKVAESAADQVEARVIAAENEWENAREALKQIIGEYEGDLDRLKDNIPFERPNPDNIDKWHELGQQNNLLIIASTNQADLAKKGIDLQFAGHMPSLDLVGNANFLSTNRPNGISSQSQLLGAELTIPIFEGGGVNARVDQARFQYEEAMEKLDVQRRATKLQVKNSFRTVIASIGQVNALKTAIASTRLALEAEQAGFEVGTRTMVDVLVVLRNLFANKRDYAKAVYDYIVNSLNLKQAASMLSREDVEILNRWLTAEHIRDPLSDALGDTGDPSVYDDRNPEGPPRSDMQAAPPGLRTPRR
ncbi:TolC family outer membrane protein [Methylotetracoccus oryzae]|uniref:TolC family outer membrane protein n=1 Tax=Methylotetracoccus oryzae TaxID=1919059 RepID=UPI0013A5A921|nr:TolC family outer membrane protein [Methylotetracoccus oryzae]